MKKQIRLEYQFRSISASMLWESISEPYKLKNWFADQVEAHNTQYTFYWDKIPHKAEVIKVKEGQSITFRWCEEGSQEKFSFTIHVNELTNDTTLEIQDTCDPSDYSVTVKLWDSQVDTLQRSLGI